MTSNETTKMTTKVSTHMETSVYDDVLNDIKNIDPQHAKFIEYCDKNRLGKKDYGSYQSFEIDNDMKTDDNDNQKDNKTSSSDENSSDEESRELYEYVVYVETTVYGRYIITAYDKQDALNTYDDGEYEIINECEHLPSRCEEL